MTDPSCPKCSAKMARGFLVDHNYYGVAESQWADGTPEVSVWTDSVKMRGRERRTVETYRCESCGYLESYARDLVK